ncbi:hypothetical protein [Paracoccus salsus]|uniref:hypothetical protein n=1 Tax=Paracoccus salsus TaxID=2911061 RepID=UPI001F26AAD7|nr:hypothetical protein [Paracoccus salsus]MCF3973391.1 hypothetical protein [Paracoccus salsus]
MSGDLPRVLFIGNSHSGALRLAYAAEPDRWPRWDVYFLGVLANRLGELDLRGGRLVPVTDAAAWQLRYYNHVRNLDVTGFDAFVIVGGTSWVRTAGICADHRSLDFPSIVAGATNPQLVGRPFLQAALRWRLQASSTGRLLSRIRSLGKPVLVVPEPMLSEDGADDRKRYAAYVDLVGRGDAGHWLSMYREARERVLGADATLLDWPRSALVDGVYTASALMRGSKRLGPVEGDAHPDDDYEHANAAYGALVMEQIMRALPAG